MTEPLSAVFQDIYTNNRWNGGESLSGPGSETAYASTMVGWLGHVLRELKVVSLLDVGCGDVNWMRMVDLGEILYTGVDLVPFVLEENRKRMPGRIFIQKDFTKDSLPWASAVLCRHALQHLSPDNVRKALSNILGMRPNYFLATSYVDHPWGGYAPDGGYFPYNLAQFGLPAPSGYLVESNQEHPDERLCIWDLKTFVFTPTQT